MNLLLLGTEALSATTLILGVAHGVAARVRHAGLRHLVRLGGLVALLLLPLFAAVFPSEFVLPATSPPTIVAAAAAPHASTLEWALFALACLWLVGTLALFVRGISGAFALRALVRHSKPHGFGPGRLGAWTARAGLDGDWRLHLSAEIDIPISWGIVRPTVLLPEPCADWPVPQLDAAMLHELAHLRRRDGLAQAIALICRALYWPHPLVWMEAKALRADAENAADDAVIVTGVKQSDYAELLLSVAAGVNGPRSFAGFEFSMAERDGLEARIQSVLAPNPSRSGVTEMQVLKTALFGTAAALVLALARPSFGADLQPAPLQPAEPAMSGADALPAPITHSELPPPSSGAPSGSTRRTVSPATSAARHARASRTAAAPSALGDHIGEAVAKAVNEAHIGDVVAKAISDAHIDEAAAMATNDTQIGEKVSAALAEAHIGEKIAAAMKAAQPKIDAAVARAERAAQAAQEAAPAVQAAHAIPPTLPQ
jgi:beta-lactamase regulating signal transducer with metallopeptidase domain